MSERAAAESVESVKLVKTPITVPYEWSAGPSMTAWLNGLTRGQLIGKRCPSCVQVYVPPRGSCPKCAVRLGNDVILPDRGTIASFCIVNVPFLGQKIKIPYVAANILLDGSDITFSHLILGCEADDVRMGMRVKAVWRDKAEWGPSLENIEYFEPTGEPDAPYEWYSRSL
jgi:uncharacterized protein